MDLLLIHPPVVRPSEPPLGVAALRGLLCALGFRVGILDLNAETYRLLLRPFDDSPVSDPFSRRALEMLPETLRAIRSPDILHRPGRYRSAVYQLRRVLWLRSNMAEGPQVTLTDFRHPRLSPLLSRDLAQMAETRDLGCLKDPVEHLVTDRILQEKPRWVGISVNYLSQALPAMALAGIVRQTAPEAGIVMGGSLVTAWGKRITDNPLLSSWVDRWVVGPGERPLARLLGAAGGAIPVGPTPPRYDDLPWDPYLSPEPLLPISLSRGCYWRRCRFCPEAHAKTTYERLNVKTLPALLERQMDSSGCRWIHFLDSALPPAALRALARTRMGARWFGFARFQAPLLDPGVVRGLRRSGCRMLQLGLESGSQSMLDRMGKGIRLEQVSRILEMLHQEGIGTYVYVLFGVPGETEADARRTLEFVIRHAPWIDFLNCSLLNLPREAAGLWDIERIPFQHEGDLGLYTAFRTKYGMERKEARLFMERRFRRHPLVSEILRRDPPSFTSSHAPLFFDAAQSSS